MKTIFEKLNSAPNPIQSDSEPIFEEEYYDFDEDNEDQ